MLLFLQHYIKDMNKNVNKYCLYSIFLFILTILSIIPLIILCKYNHPSADDFSYAVTTFHTWNNSHSFWKLLNEAISTSKYYYNHWQGLYSSAFFLALQPSIFGETYYALTGTIMLCIIWGGTCAFFVYIVKKLIGGPILDGIVIGCAASFLIIQWMPSCVEGIYWYNGAINYGLFYMIMLLLICFVISLHIMQEKKYIRKVFTCCLLGFLLEGGNHVTAFMGLIFVFCFIFIELHKKEKKKALCMSIIFIFMIICFLINFLSPGTKIRQAYFDKMGIIGCIKSAIVLGIKQIDSWIDLSPIVVVLLIMPNYIRLIKKVYTTTSFRFPNPFIVFVCSVAWICAMYCPPLYAMGRSGAGRLHNIVYYNFVILFFVNVFYCSGWIICKFNIINERSNFEINIKWVFCAITLIVGLLISKYDTTWSFRAMTILKSGEAYQYSQEAFDRNSLLLESKGKDIVVSEYSVKPEILFFDDIIEDPADWRNTAVKDFYDLNSIVIERTDN